MSQKREKDPVADALHASLTLALSGFSEMITYITSH